ncbi:MAG: DUF4387 domain-containing protein [Betaproteobacteria bacterium]
MTRTVPLSELCRVFRSKNASPFLTTIDMFFDNRDAYETVKKSGALNPAAIARRLGISEADVLGVYTQDAAFGIKVTVRKTDGVASGDPEGADIFGAQQYIPLLDLPIVVPDN